MVTRFPQAAVLIVDESGNLLFGSNGVFVQGPAAHDAAASGNPVLLGAELDNTGTDNVDEGDIGKLRLAVDRYLLVSMFPGVQSAVDSEGNTYPSISDETGTARRNNVGSLNLTYNESTWDRYRSNTEITVLATASRTASTNSADLTNYNHRGVIITLEVTTDPGSGETLQLIVEHKDGEGSNYEVLLDDGAQATPGTRSVIIYPGTAGSGNDITSTSGYPLGRTWRVRVVHSASGTWAYTVGASLVL